MSKAKIDQLIRLVPEPALKAELVAFLVDCQARQLSPKTQCFYRTELGLWCNWLTTQGIVRIQDIFPDLLRRWFVHLQQRRNAGGVHASYRAIKAFLRWAWAEYEFEQHNPIAKVQAPQMAHEPLEPVSLNDLKALLATCTRHTFAGDRDRAILLCLLDTGARASEFLALNVQDVNLSTGAVLIRHGKGGKFRTAFLGHRSRRELLRYLRHRPDTSGALWVTVTSNRLTYAGLRQVIRRRAQAAGVPAPSLHSFRRAFALTCLRGGMDVYSLQKLMGHADLSVLRRYLAQTEQDLRAAHDKAGPVDKLL